jgi:hypothetical protein
VIVTLDPHQPKRHSPFPTDLTQLGSAGSSAQPPSLLNVGERHLSVTRRSPGAKSWRLRVALYVIAAGRPGRRSPTPPNALRDSRPAGNEPNGQEGPLMGGDRDAAGPQPDANSDGICQRARSLEGFG